MLSTSFVAGQSLLVGMLLFVARVPFPARASACAAAQVCHRTASRPTRAMASASSKATPRNVLGGPLANCCLSPRTGFYRDGFCQTGPEDHGVHTICARVTADFLDYTKARGNDLSTPRPASQFPGLKPGDKWCLCASRWKEAADAGKATQVVLDACDEAALKVVSLEELRAYAV